MRPMFFEYPEDEICYTLGEQYMFGDDILFAPVVNEGQKVKRVYLPKGQWIFVKDRKEYSQGFYDIPVELTDMVAFAKKGSGVLSAFKNK